MCLLTFYSSNKTIVKILSFSIHTCSIILERLYLSRIHTKTVLFAVCSAFQLSPPQPYCDSEKRGQWGRAYSKVPKQSYLKISESICPKSKDLKKN